MKQKLFIASLILACLSLMAFTAQANLIITCRADSVNGTGLSIVPGGQTVNIVAGSTGTITFGLYTSFTNADGNNADDGLLWYSGSVLASTTGTVKGNMAAANLGVGYTWNDASTSQVGTVQDLNADGYLDVGSLGTSSTQKGDNIVPASTVQVAGVQSYRMLGAAETSFLTAEVTYTIAADGTVGTDTVVNFAPWKKSAGAGVASWMEDGVSKSGTTSAGNFGTNGDAGVALHTYLVPEPSTLVLLVMGCVALLAIRRRK